MSKQGFSRRKIILQGSAVSATKAQANTQKPPAPASGKADTNGKFQDKVVLITGATSGIGEATARAFAREGAIVHFCGRPEALGSKISQEINALGDRSSYQK